MGEVWRARDIKFDNRVVAVKLLKEDQTHREDADNRERLQRALRQEAAGGQISATLAATLLDEVLRSGRNEDVLRARVTKEADANGRLSVDAGTAVQPARNGSRQENASARPTRMGC